ncbi:MAG: hypothetical protein HRU41_18920 [Saprospiraceae bacterium]|nr:hypothetical protein [Saprospiraceae bacterium]
MPNRIRSTPPSPHREEETKIYISRPKGTLLLLILTAGAGFGISQIAKNPNFWGGYVYLLGSVVAMIGVTSYYFGPRKTQLVISKQGIQNEDGFFRSWSDITYAQVQWVKKSNTTDHYFEYGYMMGGKVRKFRTEISTWDISPTQLEKLLKDYEQQYQSSRFMGN